ncbi:hydroxymethylglutaryl-CoA synthase [Piscirickettsia salmonis]|uniref:hydroxymethylglutaryl-CoA synthase n=1 Tax=Piscirickettsia salmonis TaxID=1238 RepID=UPI0012BB00C5|nr:hydroxymethylglutaryl-CoA synthase [Piscirickettsia salmonis]
METINMQQVGIDTLGFYTPNFYLDMHELAKARNIDIKKLHIGLGQHQMGVPAPDESIVTMAANAAEKALRDINSNDIDTVLFATESGIDQSKAAGIYVHQLLKLPEFCRVIELKQACYSATAGLQMAMAMLQQQVDKNKKILLIAADIARYGLGSTGESSQGAGAIAMVLSNQPRLIRIEPGSGYHTQDVMDFWRPNYRDEALVEGKHSIELYLETLKKSWLRYQQVTGRQYSDHDRFLYHIPVPKLAEKAHQKLAMLNQQPRPIKQALDDEIGDSLRYSKQVGNCYTASLYIGLLSLLDLSQDDLTGKRLGFYSYGSGCVGEFFSGIVQTNYQSVLQTSENQQMITARTALSMTKYEEFYNFNYPQDGSSLIIPEHTTGHFRLSGFNNHKRIYQATADKSPDKTHARAPGKLILSGEHAVVHGAPAIAIAINRYTTTTVSKQQQDLSFHFESLKHKSEYSYDKLSDLKQRIKRAHQRFMQGELGIRDVLQKPFELLQFTASHSIDMIKPSTLAHGVNIHTESDIPIGCGMGSSAAGIVSLNYAMSLFFKQRISDKEQFELSLTAENMQHGQSSGIDIMLSLHGGCRQFQQGESKTLPTPAFPLKVINTGTPESTTGECVKATRDYFKKNPALTEQFALVTNQLEHAIINQDQANFIKAVRANHRLLCELGIVPNKVQTLISALEDTGAAAKICGAGTVTGQHAGIILVISDHYDQADQIAKAQGYQLEAIAISNHGVKCLD